ncbi:MAG: glycosyl hydrolase family 8 [Bacteroidetes bacterium]|nr:glycosyl hydrolase family 8 [Bacteroidota bacterium]
MTRFLTLLSTVFMTASIAFAQTDRINSGNPAHPFGANKTYKYGIMPTNLPTSGTYGSATDAANAYNYWVQDFVEDCGDGSKRVKFDQVQFTVSEGIAYGMLLSAYAGDKETFDGLWNFYKKARNGNGVMRWRVDGCSASCTGSYCNAATDAELDAAMALIVAAKQWPLGSYAAEVKAFIKVIKQHEMEAADGDTKPGDNWNSAKNPSYYSPAYYREYAKVDTDNATFWNTDAVNTAEAHLLTNRHAVTGLVSNWSLKGGAVNTSRSDGRYYGYESVRNPWRMATDYAWNGPDVAKAGKDICEKVGAFMVGKENNIRVLMEVDGTQVSGNAWKNGSSYMTSLAAMGTTNQASLDLLYTNTKAQGGRISSNVNASNYFNATLRCITLFVMTGNFWQPSTTVAIDFAKAQQSVVVYPSPATNVVNIEAAQPIKTIQVFNAMGVKILEQPANSQHETVDVSKLARGIYFVRVELTDGQVENSRFVKN